MLLLLVTISSINSNVFERQMDAACDNPCLACQKAAYKLKFQKQADCGESRCRTTCDKVWDLWGRPNSPFTGFQKDTLGKCDSCFRAGFCSITECDAQKKMEQTVIDQVVNSSQLTGLVDTTPIKEMVKKIVKNQPVKFAKYAKKIKKQIKKQTQPKTFRKNFKNIAETLKLLAGASSAKDLKAALKNVEKAVTKAKASATVKASIRKLADNFKGLIDAKKGKKDAKKVRKASKSVKVYVKKELKKITVFVKKIKNSKNEVKASIRKLKKKKVIKKKTQKKMDKLKTILANLKQVLSILENTEKDIRSTLEVIKKAAAGSKN